MQLLRYTEWEQLTIQTATNCSKLVKTTLDQCLECIQCYQQKLDRRQLTPSLLTLDLFCYKYHVLIIGLKQKIT